MKRFTIIASLVVTLACFSSAQDSQKIKAPNMILRDIYGKTVKLADFKGKVLLLNFWATWCVPCAAEAPDLVKWQNQYGDQGLQIIGITYPPTSIAKVRRFIKKNKVTYPIFLGSRATKKLFESSDTLPITVIIDRQGKIAGRINGVIFADEFETKVKPFLN
jgi:peroxiredoxin